MSQSKIKVKTKTQSYNIIIGNNLIKNLSKILMDNSMNFKKCLLVIDKKVPKKNLKNIFFLLKNKSRFIYFFKGMRSMLIKIFCFINSFINVWSKSNSYFFGFC